MSPILTAVLDGIAMVVRSAFSLFCGSAGRLGATIFVGLVVRSALKYQLQAGCDFEVALEHVVTQFWGPILVIGGIALALLKGGVKKVTGGH